MSAQVLLLRGINVGGHGRLAMADLRAHLLAIGAGTARTHIQSGNAVVARAVDPVALADRIATAHGVRPSVFALPAAEWRARTGATPFCRADPAHLHLFFRDDDAVTDIAPLQAVAADSEAVASRPGVIWLSAPAGIGRSKLAARMERFAGCPLTARTMRTAAAILALLDEAE